MRYLKRIFENDLYEQVDEVQLRDFCETYLAYILDDSRFKLEILETANWDSYMVWLSTPGREQQSFSWNEVKDYYIPFVTMLSRRYDLNAERLDQKGSSIIINFLSGDQLFVKDSEIEDWAGGDNIKEIGIVVKNTVKL